MRSSLLIRKSPLFVLRPSVISINKDTLSHFHTPSGNKGHLWLAMEILAGLHRIKRIDMTALQSYHLQIADLILERKTVQ